MGFQNGFQLELVSKELNHLAAILHVYASGLIFMKILHIFARFFDKWVLEMHILNVFKYMSTCDTQYTSQVVSWALK